MPKSPGILRSSSCMYSFFIAYLIRVAISFKNLLIVLVGRISEQFLHNRAFCEESTILTGCADFYTSMNIRYRGICEINPES